jgi:hypothetical protein
MEITNTDREKKRSLKSNQKCLIDLNRPCSRKSKSKRRYTRNELENLYKLCYPEAKKSEIKNKNMTVLCKEIISIANVVDESSSSSKKEDIDIIEHEQKITELDIKLMNINAREDFINKIIRGEILIDNLSINYPYVEVVNDYTGKSVIEDIPCNIFSAVKILKGEIIYLLSQKGVTGYPFKTCLEKDCSTSNSKIGIKILPFVNDSQWVSYDCVKENMKNEKGSYGFKRKESTKKCIQIDSKRPENVEAHLLNLFSEFVINKQTPHIVLPIMNFTCSIDNLLSNSEDISKKVDWKKRESNNSIFNFANVIVTEWASGGDLKEFILNNLVSWSKNPYCEIIWSSIFFQLIFTLVIIFEKYPNFRHNDMKVDNILVTVNDNSSETFGNYLYYVDGRYYSVPNVGFQIKLWDFDLSCIQGVVNNYKVDGMEEYGIRNTQNQYYDIHCFLNYLRLYIVGDIKRKYVPEKIQNFWRRIIPLKYRHAEHLPNVYWSRVIPDEEYTSPIEILRLETTEKSGIFNKFLINKSDIDKMQFFDEYNVPSRKV